MNDVRTGKTPAAAFAPPQGATSVFSAGVLLVDDQPGRLLAYEAILAGLGVYCVRANSGPEALQHLKTQTFAVILLDVMMPEMDGFEVARRIRADARIERTPIIFVTAGAPTERERLLGYEVGAIDYIGVPIVPEILRSKVAVLVELHQRRSELLDVNRALNQARSDAEQQHAAVRAEHAALLQAMFDHPSELMVVLDAVRDERGAISDFVYREANAAALAAIGLPREKLIGARVGDATPERAGRLIPLGAQVLRTRAPHRYEFGANGREFLITIFASGADTVVHSAVDITERKRMEAALHASEARYRALIENAPAGVAHTAMDGRFEFVNGAFCRLVGYAADELLTMTWQQITHADDIAGDAALARRALDGELTHYTIEKRYLRKDGSCVWVDLFGSFLRDEDGHAVQGIAIAIDITERRRAEQGLRDSEERFRELANNIMQFAWTCDERGHRDWFNDRWYEYSGATFEDMRGLGWQKLHHPDHAARVIAHLHECLAAGKPWQDTFPLRGKDGTYRWFLTRAEPVRMEDGKYVRWFGTNTDITEQLQLQQALEQADRRKDEFLAMLAHELRNPVAPITNASEVLALLLQDDKQRGLAQIIQRQAAHMSRLLDDLLDVARITRGRFELRRELVALQSCVDLAVETAEPLLRSREHELSIDGAQRGLLVNADRVRLAQCIANLLNNAAKYTPPGGAIRLISYADGGMAVIEVRDNGIGINAEFLPHMFDLFAQGARGLDRSGGGLGIGLSVCKQLVERHGGSVAAHSDGPGQGAAFTIRVPLATPAAAA